MSALEETESWMMDVVVRDKCIKARAPRVALFCYEGSAAERARDLR